MSRDAGPRPKLIIEIHDVQPSRLASVKDLIDRLDVMGARPRTLLVVPAALDGSDEQARELAGLLVTEQASGSEIVLHGYDHRVAGAIRGRPHDALRARLFAPHDAEFLTIGREEARRRLEAGRSILTSAGLDVRGFCAPGWLEPPWLPALLTELRFSYDVGMAVLRDLSRGIRRRLSWIGEAGAGPLHEALIGIGGTTLGWLAGRMRPRKVFFHATLKPSAARERIVDILRRELRVRQPMTYAELLGRS